MSNVQKLERDTEAGQPPYEVNGQVVWAVDIVNDLTRSYIHFVLKLSIGFAIIYGLIHLFIYSYTGLSPFNSPMAVIQQLVGVLLSSILFLYTLLGIFILPKWFKYKRLMKEGVLTRGVIVQCIELPEQESNIPIPHIMYTFEEGYPTLQRVNCHYSVGMPITVRYVPKKPRLSRAELS